VPKAKPFPDSEDEKTTIESQWEDEASTTVEEGHVADKIRSLGVEPRRGNTSVTGTGVDEPTVDDQHAQISAITPVRDVARLVITAGNDAGQEIEVRPGKTYTIGRAIDNDVVLTDIAVSRKHFDLKFEDGAWVIADRGSGNGTVVNGNLEDNPFMLANGDVIEIGNTVFRFDQPNAAARPERTIDLDRDEEEMSTVAGKPLRKEPVAAPPSVAAAPRPARPKTLPPPTPVRPLSQSQPPPLGFSPHGPAQQPAAAQPIPQMANRPPLAAPAAPTMLGDAAGGNGVATTMPGQGGAPQPPLYSYPQATEIPPHSVHAQMLMIQTQNRRGDGSTAHVPSLPFEPGPQPPRYAPPQLTKRAKMVLAALGLAMFAAVTTVAIVKSGGDAKATAAKHSAGSANADGNAVAAKTAVPLRESDSPATKTAPGTAPSVATAPPGATGSATAESARPETPTSPPPHPGTRSADADKLAAPKTDTARTVSPPPEAAQTVAPTRTETAKTVAPTRTETAKTVAPTRTETAKTTPTRTETKSAKIEPKRREARREPPPSPAPAGRRVATADAEAIKSQADSLYRAKKFNEASSLLANAAKKVDEEDAKELRRTSDIYAKLGRALAQGTAPATKSTEAFEALRQAQNYDRNVGSAFDGEIQSKLAQVAPKAALSYVASKNWQAARSAMLIAQQFGASESVKIVAQKLESAAGEIYNEGVRELASNPTAAKEKFRQVKAMVDAKSTWYQKAQKQLGGG
jgi:hypothetical protein